MQLELKAIPGYQYYYASKAGDIYSITPERPQEFFDLSKLQVTQKDGKYYNDKTGYIKIVKLKPFENSTGYLQVTLCLNGKCKKYLVHRLIMLTFAGKYPPGMETNHRDLNPKNNEYKNLEFVTPSENVKHARKARNKNIYESVEGAF